MVLNYILIGRPCTLISYKLKIWKYVTIQDSALIALTMSCLHEVDWNRIVKNGTNCMNKLFSSFYKFNAIVNKQTTMKKNHLIAKQGSYLNPGKLMELRRVLRLKINYMHLETRLLRCKHCRNKICTLVRVSKRRYYDTKIIWPTWKKPGKESMNFYVDEKKLKVISTYICP